MLLLALPNLHTCILLVEVYGFGHCLGERFLAISTFFSLVSSRTFRNAPHSRFRCWDLNQCFLNFLKMLLLTFPKSTHVYFTCKSLSLLAMLGLRTLADLYLFFTRVFSRVKRCGTLKVCVWGFQIMLTCLFKNASFGPPPNLHRCILNVEVYWFRQCLGYIFFPMSIFLSPACFSTFRYSAHSRFRYEDPNQCLPNFIKMLLLALRQIYTSVFYLWKTIDLGSVKFGDSRPYQFSFLS